MIRLDGMRASTRAALLLGVVVVAAGAALAFHEYHSGAHGAWINVRDAETGRHLWSRRASGGYAVVLAVTPRAALVADADDCIHQGPGTIEILTPARTTFVSQADACQIYRFRAVDGVDAHLSAGTPRRLVVQVPSQLGGGIVRLPCPCPAPVPAANGAPGSPVRYGATEKVDLGSFTSGAD